MEPFPPFVPDVQHMHGVFNHGEQNAVGTRALAVNQLTNLNRECLALFSQRAALRKTIEGLNRGFQTIEPLGGTGGRVLDHPEIRLIHVHLGR